MNKNIYYVIEGAESQSGLIHSHITIWECSNNVFQKLLMIHVSDDDNFTPFPLRYMCITVYWAFQAIPHLQFVG